MSANLSRACGIFLLAFQVTVGQQGPQENVRGDVSGANSLGVTVFSRYSRQKIRFRFEGLCFCDCEILFAPPRAREE